MPIEIIHTFLVHPEKQSDQVQQVGGTVVPLTGKLFDLLKQIYEKSDQECDIDIAFNHGENGQQTNPCRTLILNYLNNPTVDSGEHLAERLSKATDNRSGMGLLFLICGMEGNNRKFVISRFPAHHAILAEGDNQNLSVEFVDRVFLKSSTTYKSAAYQDISLATGFWYGKAVDKQATGRSAGASDYWIGAFLESGFRTTPAAGTRRLAIAVRDAVKKSGDTKVKSEIAAAVTLARNLNGERISINDFNQRFHLSDEAKQAISNEVKSPQLLAELFQFDQAEFSGLVAYRSVELDTGAILTASSATFDTVFQSEQIEPDDNVLRYTAEGRVVSESVRKSR